jgi:site-specific DNA-cytosine methylase
MHIPAIDLIIGGPPCIDYSAVNAGRQGTQGVQGSYLLRFGRLIRHLERLQERSGQQKLFFLVENVFLREQDLVEIRDAFGIDWNPFEFDAHYISP